MLRLFVLLLAFVLPVQFAWAGAAAYCQHETGPATVQHFGHHDHVHKSSAGKAAEGKLGVDNDCGVCHAGCSQPLPMHSPALATTVTVRALNPEVVAQPSSAPPGAPDRPQWPRLA